MPIDLYLEKIDRGIYNKFINILEVSHALKILILMANIPCWVKIAILFDKVIPKMKEVFLPSPNYWIISTYSHESWLGSKRVDALSQVDKKFWLTSAGQLFKHLQGNSEIFEILCQQRGFSSLDTHDKFVSQSQQTYTQIGSEGVTVGLLKIEQLNIGRKLSSPQKEAISFCIE